MAHNDDMDGNTHMADNKMLEGQVRTYSGMIGIMKWGTAAVALLAAVVIWLIAS